jgi:hypothetical protein
MSGVFQYIDPPPPQRPASVYPPPLVRGEVTLTVWTGGWGVNILEDARHCSLLYIRKFFVPAEQQFITKWFLSEAVGKGKSNMGMWRVGKGPENARYGTLMSQIYVYSKSNLAPKEMF